MSTEVVILVAGDALGNAEHAGEYIESFDPNARHPLGLGKVTFTSDVRRARRFPGISEALAFWKTQSPTVPLRDDGRPNRPLTAYTITFQYVKKETST